MRTTFDTIWRDLSPFTIGFDRTFDTLSLLAKNQAQNVNYPPYNIRKLSDNKYSIELALAGFEEKDIDKLSAGLTKEQVQFILGTALIKDPFHSQRWDYYYSVKVGTEILSERKISILFDENNLVDSWTIEEIDVTD